MSKEKRYAIFVDGSNDDCQEAMALLRDRGIEFLSLYTREIPVSSNHPLVLPWLFAPEGEFCGLKEIRDYLGPEIKDSITIEAKPDLVGFPCVLESDDSLCEVTLCGKIFVVTKVRLMGENIFSCPGRLCLNDSIIGSSLIVYNNGLVVLLNKGRHVFAIHAINKPFGPIS